MHQQLIVGCMVNKIILSSLILKPLPLAEMDKDYCMELKEKSRWRSGIQTHAQIGI